MARPQFKVDEALLERLIKLQLSLEIVAHCVGCSRDTLERRFAAKIEQWRSESKSKIASVLFDEAVNKREPWALKALAQRHLDYHDKVKTEVTEIKATEKLTEEQIQARIDELQGKLNETK